MGGSGSMGIDNLEEQNEEAGNEMAQEENKAPSPAVNNPDNEEKASRMDAAKAFFRAMYAGDEPEAQAGAAAPPADSRRVQELEQALKDSEQKSQDFEGLYKRMAADFDNFRRRVEREREEYSNIGVRKAFESIMPALDDLDRAMAYLSPDIAVDKVIESFKLVSSRLFSCLEQAGMKRIETAGELFDPRFHEPVQQIETTEHPDGAIVNELRAGFSIGDKVIRPALVNVASNNSPAQHSANDVHEEAAEQKAEEANSEGSKKVKSEPGDDKVYDLGDPDDLGV